MSVFSTQYHSLAIKSFGEAALLLCYLSPKFSLKPLSPILQNAHTTFLILPRVLKDV